MKIDESKCVACGNCTYVCPMGAIYIDPKTRKATINPDECVECYACYNGLSKEHLPPKTVRATRRFFSNLWLRFEPDPDICPTDAILPDELGWPRIVRRAFSDPRVPQESTGVAGRGTEEVKTNDVSNRISVGMVGLTIEFGRPGVGVRFRQIQEMSMTLAAMGVKIQPKNPVTAMMDNVERGTIRSDILDEKVLSAILEITVPVSRTEEIIRAVWEVEKKIDTVVVLGVGTRCDDEGEERVVAPILEKLGYELKRAKTNLGLGRPQIRTLSPLADDDGRSPQAEELPQ